MAASTITPKQALGAAVLSVVINSFTSTFLALIVKTGMDSSVVTCYRLLFVSLVFSYGYQAVSTIPDYHILHYLHYLQLQDLVKLFDNFRQLHQESYILNFLQIRLYKQVLQQQSQLQYYKMQKTHLPIKLIVKILLKIKRSFGELAEAFRLSFSFIF